MDASAGLRFGAAGLILVLLPGFFWSRVLLKTRGRLERFVASIVLSIALLMLALYVGNTAFGVSITAVHAVWWAGLLMAAAGALGAWLGRPADVQGPSR